MSPLNGAVVYCGRHDSLRKLAEGIAGGLAESGYVVSLMEAESVEHLDPDLVFLVVGSPARAGRAARAPSRLIKRRMGGGWAGKPYAVFATGIRDGGGEPQSKGADQLHRLLRERGLLPLAEPFKACVQAAKGPLEEGEFERAVQFGRDLAAALRR